MMAIATQTTRQQPVTGKPVPAAISNSQIEQMFNHFAESIKNQPDNEYRAQAYRKAARTIGQHTQAVSDIFAEQGTIGLMTLPGIGQCISSVLAEILETGHWRQFDQFKSGVKKPNDSNAVSDSGVEPPAPLLLRVDQIYRDKAAAGVLELIAPAEFNPSGRHWLPVLKTELDGWMFTVMFSNSLQAHQHGRVRDWVVIHFSQDSIHHGRRTVVTALRGTATGQRVVRGREKETHPKASQTAATGSSKPADWQQMSLNV